MKNQNYITTNAHDQKRLLAFQIIERLIKKINDLKAIENNKKRQRFQQKKLNDNIKSALFQVGQIVRANSGFVALARFKSNYAETSGNLSFNLIETAIPELEIPVITNKGKLQSIEFKNEKNITGLVIATGKIYYCPNTANDKYFKNFLNSDNQIKSEIGIPLKFQNETFGAMILDSTSLDGFSKNDQNILKSISIPIALLIKRFNYLNKLLDLSVSYKSIDNINKLYKEICVEAINILDAKVSYLRILEKDNLVIKGNTGIKTKLPLPLKIGEGVSGLVALTHKPINIENIQIDPRYKHQGFANSHELYAMLSVPIVSKEIFAKSEKQNVVGVLNIYANRISKFTSLDKQLLFLIADKAGKAINKAMLIGQLNEISKIEKELTTKSEIKALKKIAEIAKTLLSADSVVLYQYNKNVKLGNGLITPSIMAGEFFSQNSTTYNNLNTISFLNPLLESRATEFYIDWNNNTALINSLYEQIPNLNVQTRFYKQEKLASTVILKLIFKVEIVGILFLNYRYRKVFSASDKRIAHIFANKAAIAISSIRKYDDLNTLHRIGHAIVGTTNLKHLLAKIADSSLETLKADIISLYRWDNSLKQPITPPITAGNLMCKDAMTGPPNKNDIQYKVANQRNNIFESNVQNNKLFTGDKETERERYGNRFIDRENIKSCAIILLTVHEEIVGLMFISYREKQHFITNQRRIIEIFATQAAIAIRNANLFKQYQDTNKRLKSGLAAIEQASTKIISSLDKPEISEKDILQPILDAVLYIIGVDLGYISMYLKKQKQSKIINISPRYKKLKNAYLNIDYSKQELFRQRKEFDIFDYKSKGEYQLFSENPNLILNKTNFTEDKNVKSALRVPLYYQNNLLGMIVLESEKEGFFTLDYAHTVVSLANQASIAINNYRLINQLNKLQKIDKAILSKTGTLEDVLGIILKSALELVNKEYGEISLLINEFELETVKWHPQNINLLNTVLNIHNSVCGCAINTKESYYVSDVSVEPLFIPTPGVETKSELVIPLMVDKQAIGVLNIESEILNDFSQEEIRILEMLSGQAAIAINLVRQKEQLIEKEKAANLGYITRESVHWIGNKIGPIKRRAENLKKELCIFIDKHPNEKEFIRHFKNDINIIFDGATAALSIKSDLLDEPAKDSKCETDIINVLKNTIINFKKEFKCIEINQELRHYKYKYNFSFRSSVKLFHTNIDNKLIFRVFYYFLKNSFQAIEDRLSIQYFNPKTFKGHIKVNVEQIDNTIQISFLDNGIGISDNIKNKIFDPFFSTKGADRGHGIGLFFCQRILNNLGGVIKIIETGYCQGTTIQIELPNSIK